MESDYLIAADLPGKPMAGSQVSIWGHSALLPVLPTRSCVLLKDPAAPHHSQELYNIMHKEGLKNLIYVRREIDPTKPHTRGGGGG
eukprot:SAG11_NODE_8512_length_1007_cov_1.584802_1_plen_85_part_10